MTNLSRRQGLPARLRSLAGIVLAVFVLAALTSVLHDGVGDEEHCSGKGNHCLLCHSDIGSVPATQSPEADDRTEVSCVAVETLSEPAACGDHRLLPPGRAPPAV